MVLRYLSNLRVRAELWYLTGPSLLLLALVAWGQRFGGGGIAPHSLPPWMALVGLLASIGLRWWGAGISLLLLGIPFLGGCDLWTGGWIVAVASSWVLGILTSSEARHLLDPLEQQQRQLTELNQQLKESLTEAEQLAQVALERSEAEIEHKRELLIELEQLREERGALIQSELELRESFANYERELVFLHRQEEERLLAPDEELRSLLILLQELAEENQQLTTELEQLYSMRPGNV